MEENKKILLATSNKGKLKEFNDIFNNYELISQSELNIEDAIEDGLTFFENALIKARHGSRNSGLFSIADDSGLVVPALNFEPGIYSARYAKDGASDLDKSTSAYYVCVLVGVHSPEDPMPIFSLGKIHGRISVLSSGEGGFGYDKIFYPDELDVSMASLEASLKNKISHRAIAAQLFLKELDKDRS